MNQEREESIIDDLLGPLFLAKVAALGESRVDEEEIFATLRCS